MRSVEVEVEVRVRVRVKVRVKVEVKVELKVKCECEGECTIKACTYNADAHVSQEPVALSDPPTQQELYKAVAPFAPSEGQLVLPQPSQSDWEREVRTCDSKKAHLHS